MTVDLDAQLAAAGDMEAFENIHRRYHHRVYAVCLRMIRNATQAEDLAQEVFIQLFAKSVRFAATHLLVRGCIGLPSIKC